MMYCPWTQEELEERVAMLPARAPMKVVLDRSSASYAPHMAVEPRKTYVAVRAPGRKELVVTDDVGRQRYIQLGKQCRHHTHTGNNYARWLPAECSLL